MNKDEHQIALIGLGLNTEEINEIFRVRGW